MIQPISSFDRPKRIALFFILLLMLAYPLSGSFAADNRQLDSGPFSLSLRGGGTNDATALGVDGRVDYLNQLLNLHLFGTFDLLDGGRGEGRISNTRYGGGLAVSHTFARQANLFAGSSLIRDMDKNFGHAYVGGKLKLTDYALLSTSYGFGFEKAKVIQSFVSSYLAGEAVDWLKAGGVLVNGQGLKANLYYHLTDPAGEKISGVEGELSYAILDNLTLGANMSTDLTRKTDQNPNWRSFLFVTYAFGGQKGSPIDIALDKNNPIEYPQIVRKTIQKSTAPASTLKISRLTPDPISGCSSQNVNFSASGGTPPYTWSANYNGVNSTTGSTTSWTDYTCIYMVATNVTVTVTDSLGASASSTFTLQPSIPN